MRLLAFDTAMAACSVAVIDTGCALPLAAEWIAMERGHAEALPPMVQRVMAKSGLAFGDLERIVVTTGPGTFTGVRIGLAMARGLGLALGIPVTGIDTLAAIAVNADGAVVLVAAEARNDEVYFAFDGAPPALATAQQASAAVSPGTPVIGTAADRVIAQSGGRNLVRSGAGDLPVAAVFGRKAALLPAPSGMPSPLYLRAPDARPQPSTATATSFRVLDSTGAALLAALHAECFDTPWTAEDFRQLLAMPGASAVAAIERGEPMGFALLRHAADEAEIITIGTRPFARRRGVARLLLDHLLTDDRAATVFIEVARSNEAAQSLYAASGFLAVGARPGYYARGDAREDAIIMRRDKTP